MDVVNQAYGLAGGWCVNDPGFAGFLGAVFDDGVKDVIGEALGFIVAVDFGEAAVAVVPVGGNLIVGKTDCV